MKKFLLASFRKFQQFRNNHRRALFVMGCMLLCFTAISVMTGCAVPSFLTDIEAVISVGGSALAGILALLGSVTGNAAEEAASAAITVIVSKVDAGLTEVNSLITQYKANPSDTLLENIEAGIQEAVSDLGNILTIEGLPAATATAIQNAAQAFLNQLKSLLTLIPVFKSSTAGASMTVVKPLSAAAFKAQIHTALKVA